MPFDDDIREPPEPPAKCFDCGRVSVDADRCVYCGSPLMVSDQTLATIVATRAHRPTKRRQKSRAR